MQFQQTAITLPYLWYWKGDDGSWNLYDGSSGFVSSDDVEKSYQRDHHGFLTFRTDRYSYKIDFASRIQLNETTKKKRRMKRRGVKYDWYWQDSNGQWQKYDSTVGGDSLDLITASYRDKTKFRFTLKGNFYTIDFENMIEKNKTTGTTRPVKREVSDAPLVLARRVHTQSQPVVNYDWYWLDDTGSWQMYTGKISSNYIDAKFRADPNATLKFDQYEIDFNTMEQTNLKTGFTRQIMRKPKGVPLASAASYFPNTWDFNAPSTAQFYQLVDVSPNGSTAGEYQAVERLFNKSMPLVRLKAVKRIQNKRLWEPFDLARSQLEGRLGRGNGVEQLFHGGSQSSYGAICAQGIDWRLCGKSHGTAFGRGSYFARKATLARRYADSNTLIVAQVLVGEYTMGSRDITRPPPKVSSKPDGFLYDSCVDDLNNPTMFVVFERAHSYPEYLIEY